MAYAQDISLPASDFRSVPFVTIRQSLPSRVYLVSLFIDQLMVFISRYRGTHKDNFALETALREALVNAIVHGNRQNSNKLVRVKCRCSSDGDVSIRVEDEGCGFDSQNVPDPTSANNLLRPHGRGIYLMRALMDEVDFEQGGSVVHMRKRASSESREMPAPVQENVQMACAGK
jgi:serine/threonine-protein kinase RsbW